MSWLAFDSFLLIVDDRSTMRSASVVQIWQYQLSSLSDALQHSGWNTNGQPSHLTTVTSESIALQELHRSWWSSVDADLAAIAAICEVGRDPGEFGSVRVAEPEGIDAAELFHIVSEASLVVLEVTRERVNAWVVY